MTANDPQTLASFLKAVADPLRIAVLRLLAQDSYGVMELATLFDVKQSGMSHHLKLLAKVGLVATRREGNSIFYRRALAGPGAFGELQRQLFEQIDVTDLPPEVIKRLESVRAERVANSRKFFSDNSEKFRIQQDLIASYPVYQEALGEMLQQLHLNRTKAIEVGPGEGEFLAVLSKRFEQVLAIDINQAMLNKAAMAVDKAKLINVELRLGDIADLHRQNESADLVVANMVLHHLPSPVVIFDQARAVLNDGGTLLVTDLCLHDQSWTREACGDIWLGFDPDDLNRWAENSGFMTGESMYLALRNGFQIQLRQFYLP
jgi:ArsR family transcriptional regulator